MKVVAVAVWRMQLKRMHNVVVANVPLENGVHYQIFQRCRLPLRSVILLEATVVLNGAHVQWVNCSWHFIVGSHTVSIHLPSIQVTINGYSCLVLLLKWFPDV